MANRSSWLGGLAKKAGGIYLQFLIIVAIMAFFAYVLNAIYGIEDHETRILMSSVFLAFFTAMIVMSRKL
jgi:hypothetical protein